MGLALGAILAAGLFGACTLTRSGAVEARCSRDADCNDEAPCTRDVCSALGLCEHPPNDRSDGLVQVPGDCKELVCSGGAAVEQPRDDDVPDNPCVDASCSGGVLTESVKPNDTECTVGNGTGSCQDGTCVVLCGDDPTVCNDLNPCTDDDCDAVSKTCIYEPLDNVVSPEDDGVGDCRVDLCVQGTPQPGLVDDSDVPDDGNPCTDDGCSNGDEQYVPVAAGTPCGPGGTAPPVCDDTGLCLDCDSPADCPGMDTVCQKRTCQNRVCGIVFSPSGTSCDDGAFCNGADSCDGQGTCLGAGSPCPGPDGDSNCFESCNEGTDSCDAHDGQNAPCQDGTFCNGADSCDQSGCNLHAGDPCPGPDGDADCQESCKESNDSCTEQDPDGSTCNDGVFCNGVDTCDEGACSEHPGDPCPGPDGDFDCTESCNESNDSCSGNDPSGSSCDCGFWDGECSDIGICCCVC